MHNEAAQRSEPERADMYVRIYRAEANEVSRKRDRSHFGHFAYFGLGVILI